ncbi:hypothetical protein TSAR_014537 [Trichomalopsis sarcophagae]|uniref:UBC core domain-containing protein n=1 Tax=Trichomalopsis sarcophagae TaxID=543379 RepID=A0A232EGM3_9HYME|nr:hypothetical protein TSAR_014537 [Trichomalopsis sarcophagae]
MLHLFYVKSEGDSEDDLKRQGSFRKLLPVNSNGDSQLSTAVKMIDRPNTSQNIWFGVQFIRQGIYQGGVFRFTITLPQNFPDGKCPNVVFQTKVFHPLINYTTGELNTAWGFPEWKRSNRIWQLVQYISKIFTKLDTKMISVNDEALLLLETDFENFKEQAKKCVKDSLSVVYDPPATDDPHYITFSPYDSELHDPVKQEIYKPKDDNENKPTGYSWVQPGSLQPFSKPEAR